MCLQKEIAGWCGKKSTTKRELLSLIGQLQHACYVGFFKNDSLVNSGKGMHH